MWEYFQAPALPTQDDDLVLPTQDDFRIWSINGVPVVSTPPEIDLYSAPMLSRAIIAASAHATVVVVDMSGTTFCDCAGLGALVRTYRRMGESGVEVRVVSCDPRVQAVLAITEYDQVLPIFDNLAEAATTTARNQPPYRRAA